MVWSDHLEEMLKQIPSSMNEPSSIIQIEDSNANQEDLLVITKKYKKEDSITNNYHITRVDIQFKNISLSEYTIDDMIFNILSLHDIGHLSETPLAIGTLIPLGP